MKATTKLVLAIGVFSALPLSAIAATVSATASVTVQNAFSLSQTTALSFGTIRAKADTSGSTNHVASLIVNPDGSASTASSTGANASITVISQGTPAVFAISNAAPNTNLTITSPGTVTLSRTGGGGANFTVDTWAFRITSGTNANTAYSTGSPNLLTDNTGAVTFAAGATISTQATTPSADYTDGSYTGTYNMVVNY